MNALLPISLLLCSFVANAQEACPDLQSYYDAGGNSWQRVVEQLVVLQPSCLRSAEFYALLGAAQLNSGNVDAALEALERALLLDPEHGGAGVDYAQALYLDGQMFPALQLGEQLLQRADIPPQLVTALRQRQEIWRAQTRNRGFALEVALGHDSNLNGAPSRGDFTLTLSGEALQLTLDEKFRPVRGPYANLRLSGNYQWLAPSRIHDLAFGVRNRQSEFKEAELLQADWRYSLGLMMRRYRWDIVAGSTYLQYGGSPLFTATDLRARLRRADSVSGCKPLGEIATQHQLYHQQSFMAGIEYGITTGVECRFDERRAQLGVEVGAVHNRALKASRPGENRNGWLLRMIWQQALGPGVLRAQYSLTGLRDDSGYSELLANGARRQIYSRQSRLQYLYPLSPEFVLQFNLNHQRQGSNLAPFESHGTAVDLGFTLEF